MRYKLIIDNNLIEVEETELSQVSIALNKQYEALNNPTLYFAEWSKSVNIPFTQRNNRIFSNIFRVDGLVTNLNIDPRKKIDFILLYNEEIVTRGYCKVTNIYNNITNKYYQVNLFSTLGNLLNEIKSFTFFTNADIDEKYVIQNPLTEGLVINKELVKDSFEKDSCIIDIANKKDLDYIGFAPSYQGKYTNFESGKYDTITDIIEHPQGENDEHYIREFRSYYQTPYIWVNALFQLVKQKLESITDYKLILDRSFFNKNNPYWTNTIYTCPSLFKENDDTTTTKENYKVYEHQYKSQTTVLKDSSNHHTKILPFERSSGDYIYEPITKRFHPESSSVHFKESVVWWLFASAPYEMYNANYCKLREDNALYLKFKAVNANTNKDIVGAEQIFCFYDGENTRTNFDVGIELDVTNRDYPRAVMTAEEGVTDKDKGFLWSGELQVEFNINTSEPFYIVCDQYTANNDKAFETSLTDLNPHWDWTWSDLFDDGKGFTWYVSCVRAEVENTQNIRSNSALTMERIWSKDTSIYDVIINFCKQFHLMFDLNEDTKELIITTRDRYFEPYSIEDWSDKIDRNKDYILQPIWFDKKYLNFKYTDGKGERFDYYQSKYKVSYGEQKVNTEYDFSNEEENLIEGLNPSMVCTKKQSSVCINTYDPQQPNFKGYGYKVLPAEVYIENDNNGTSANNFGAFYFHNGKIQVDGTLSPKDNNNKPIIFISDDSTLQIKRGVYCWGGNLYTTTNYIPFISLYSADGKLSILFNEPKELYFNREVVPYNNPTYIYKGYWEKYFNERYNVQNKMLTCYLYLTPTDYKYFKFNKFVLLDNILYLVNKIIDFDMSTKGSTKVELLQIYNLDAYLNGNIKQPYLYTVNSKLFVTSKINSEYVYSTSDWSITRKPYWLNLTIENNYIYYSVDTQTNNDRTGYIYFQNTEGLNYIVEVVQEGENTYLDTNPNTVTFSGDGGSSRIKINSYPDSVHIVNKPDWVNVRVNKALNTNNLVIECDTNTTVLGRQGNIVLTNGVDNVKIIVNQQGHKTLTITDTNGTALDLTKPIILSGTTDTTITVTLDKEINPNTLTATNIIPTKPEKKIGALDITLPITQTKSTEISGGGVIRVNQTDNTTVMIDYNIGESIQKYMVYIDGNVLVDDINYYPYYELIELGTELNVTVVESEEKVFQQWSDGNVDISRTIVVNNDIHIYPVFVENVYSYDNNTPIKYDNEINIEP